VSGPVRAGVALVATTLGAALLVFGVGAPPERCPDIAVAEVETAAAAAVDWIVDNQRPDGRGLYEYDRVADRASDDYNIVRHAGVMMALYQAAARGHVGARESADRGLGWALDHLVERHGWAGVTTTSTVQAGTNALLVAGLVERRELTGDTTYDDVMTRLARFLDSQVEESGALLAYYDLEPDRPRADVYSIYYTGEAYWALGRMHRTFPESGWGTTADRMGNYMATVRDDVEDIWPPLADHWSGYGLGETAAFPDRPAGAPLTDAELDFVRRQGGLIGQRVRSISQRFGPWGPAVRGTFTPRGGGYGVFGEGLAGLWRASVLDDRLEPERDVLAQRATCISALALEAQTGADEAGGYAAPGKVEGAWFIDDLTRMDDQQHALSALLFTVPILEAATDAPGTGSHPAPMWILWLIVVLGVFAPVRFAVGTRDVSVRSIAIGAAGGGAILATFASLSGWVIAAVDTSLPAMRLATASLCLLTAGIDIVRPRPSLDGETDERTAWLVPVAVPLVVRPALLLGGLSVVADHSVPFHLLALTIAIGSGLLLAVLRFAERVPPAAATWLSRTLSAAAVVASVLLIADAVFDI
jgi:hypothetical protein